MTVDEPISVVHALRRRWKPTKDRLKDDQRFQPILVRIHRCCSWMQRVEELGDEAPDDAALLFLWIALNSLYGRWDEEAREPVPDRECLPSFLDRVRELDTEGRIAAILEEHRKLVMSIFDDAYLTRYFWEEPTDARARRTRKTKFDARTWYLEERYGMILWRLAERIYFLRCQLVHGAATFGGGLNRTALRRCRTMLWHLLPEIVTVIIDHGAEEAWGAVCYPPMRTRPEPPGRQAGG